MEKSNFILILIDRIPVPNDGACDWGLNNANIIASCEVCAKYYDPRTNFQNQPCVYVPHKSRCWPANLARNKNWITKEAPDCVTESK